MSLKSIHIIGHSLPAITLVLGLPMVILDIAQRYSYARALGTISLLLFILTLIPGIIRRFELTQTSWGKTLTQLILPIRRQLGIAMFLTAIWHAMGLRWEVFQGVIETGVPPEPPLFEILGTLSLLILTPLFLTSNNLSTRILKRGWKHLHRLTYLAGWLLFGHVALQGGSWQTIVIGLIMIVEVTSLLYAIVKK